MNNLKQKSYHPIIFAIYPVLFLYSYNLGIVQLQYVYRTLGIIVGCSIILWLVLSILTKNPIKGALITTISLILFFSYGHLLSLVGNFSEKIFSIDRNIYLSIQYTIVWIIIVLIILRSSAVNLKLSNQFANVIGTILLIFPIYTVFSEGVFKNSITKDGLHYKMQQYLDFNYVPDELPDIYYIILDGYAREDVLRDIYEFDNSNFYSELEKRGFFIARRSNANYPQTMHSFASSLNMQYIQDLLPDIDKFSYSREPLADLISDNVVSSLLKTYGYKFVVFSSGYSGTEIPSADVYLSPAISINEFENIFLNTTPLGFIAGKLPVKSQYDLHVERIMYTFDNIPSAANGHSPAFVFAPIVMPHPPFVFHKDGLVDEFPIGFSYSDGSHYHDFEYGVQEEYKRGYLGQLQYANKLALSTIDNLLEDTEKPRIIVLQSDHGPGMVLDWEIPENSYYRERLGILNAYYVNNETNKLLYDTISPVNTFRVLLNSYFGASFPLLEDHSYVSRWTSPYHFFDVSDSSGIFY